MNLIEQMMTAKKPSQVKPKKVVKESKKHKKVKEDLSYGELAAIESEWEKFKKKNRIISPASVEDIEDFISIECKGVYDTEDERDEVRSTIEVIETSEDDLSESKKLKKVKESYNNEIDEIWDFLVDNSIATDDELRLVTDINGYSVDTLNDVIYARTGYRSIDQLNDELDESKKHRKVKKLKEGTSLKDCFPIKKGTDIVITYINKDNITTEDHFYTDKEYSSLGQLKTAFDSSILDTVVKIVDIRR